MTGPTFGKREFETLSEFRYRLCRCLRFSEKVTRRQSKADRREVEIHPTAQGERMVTRTSQLHRDGHLNPAGSFLLPQLQDLQEDWHDRKQIAA